MFSEKEIKMAFDCAVERENGNLNQFAHKVGMDYSVLHNIRSGKTSLFRMRVETLSRMFPDMKVFFFREDYPSGGGMVSVKGANHGAIANGNMSVAVSRPMLSPRQSTSLVDAISRSSLELQFLNAEEFTAEERIKILQYLKNKVK